MKHTSYEIICLIARYPPIIEYLLLDPHLVNINTKDESLMIDKIHSIFILLLIKEKILSYHNQQDIISSIPKRGATQYMKIFSG